MALNNVIATMKKRKKRKSKQEETRLENEMKDL